MSEHDNPIARLEKGVISLKLEATPEEIERFLNELAYAVLATARHLVDEEEGPQETNDDTLTDAGEFIG